VLTEARGEPLCDRSDATFTQVDVSEDCLFTAVLMFLIQLGAGLGGIAILSHGLSFVDDHVNKGSSAAFIGKTRHRLRGTGRCRGAQNSGMMGLSTRKYTTDTQIHRVTNVTTRNRR
jgi:hypothetical protein